MDPFVTNLIVDEVRRDRLRVEPLEFDQDGLNALAGKTLPELMFATIADSNRRSTQAGRPFAELHLPRQDEFSLGQLFQLLMLTMVAEARLLGSER